MLYNWECECGGVTEVERRVADIDLPPEKCEHCDNTNFKQRVLTLPQSKRVKGFILQDTGVGWPSHGFYNDVQQRK